MLSRRLFTAVVLGSIAWTAPGQAQDARFSARPLRMVVPFAAGGGVDTLARLIADKLQGKLNTSVVVENRAGANGTVGGSHVAQSTPDGHTLLFSSSTHTMSKLVMANPPYDPVADFTPIARVGEAPMLVILASNMPQKNLADIAAAAKANPNGWTAGTPALGSPGHIATIQFMRLANTNLTVTPYRGTAPALNDVAGGHIQMLMDAIIALLPMAKEGRVKPIAVTTKTRTSLAPDIPTGAESGLPGLEVVGWYGLWGPKSMSDDAVKVLNAATNAAVRELAADGKLAAIGVEAVTETPAEFARYMAEEVGRNGDLLKSVNFQPQ